MKRYLATEKPSTRPVDFLADLRDQARPDPEDRALLERWERLTLTVRCALHAQEANYIRLYIASGQRLLKEGIGKPVPMYMRLLLTLIRTAEDVALPAQWRQMCAEHFDVPLARLRTLLARRDPLALQAIDCRAESARRQLLAGG